MKGYIPILYLVCGVVLIATAFAASPTSESWADIAGPTQCLPLKCGNGRVERATLGSENRDEECDDGNTVGGDGCDSNCRIESSCRNGKLDKGEECDDGNSRSSDGCSSGCKIECGWTCSGLLGEESKCSKVVSDSCGNHIREGNEQCDDGNVISGDGCSANCRIESGWRCDTSTAVTRDQCNTCWPICGDKRMLGGEACDDGNSRSGDGCDRLCKIECGYKCVRYTPVPEINRLTQCPIPQEELSNCTLVTTCGDGIVGRGSKGEQCDDGNKVSGDGCSSDCRVESNFECHENGCGPSVCKDTCGSGLISGNEECDDGNRSSGDGCDRNCKLEPGWRCERIKVTNGTRTRCFPRSCGDGVRHDAEDCDDGNKVDGDGCSRLCVTENDFTCVDAVYPDSPRRSSCRDRCGNGRRTAWEECDTGSTLIGGCDGLCRRRCGYKCTDVVIPGAPTRSDCQVTCGDGEIGPEEDCDDGNTVNGDGCDFRCKAEATHVCDAVGTGRYELPLPLARDDWNDRFDSASDSKLVQCKRSVCTFKCGDGILTSNEECDIPSNTPNGCKTDCKADCGVTCKANTCAATRCGDGIKAFDEECDDGNTTPGDGCDAKCKIEDAKFTCTQVKCAKSICTPRCGSGIKSATKQCDDGNEVSFDGCSSSCKIECGYTCTDDAAGLSTCKIGSCGDGITGPGETCDDGNTENQDGCSSTCQTESGYNCNDAGSCKTVCTPQCRSGIKGIHECDDKNPNDGDGCSSKCTIECGYTCTEDSTGLSSCVNGGCGDGVKGLSEQCDDGNTINGDGCDSLCQIEKGWTCPPSDGTIITSGGANTCRRSVCTPLCNGIKAPVLPKQCDYGAIDELRGCFANCTTRCGFKCTGNPLTQSSVCSSTCGDGIRSVNEECDDGNIVSGDGCDASCKRETDRKWHCDTPECGRSVCWDTCGTGFKNATEGCDDNNNRCGDGCSGTCRVECGYSCKEDTNGLSTCAPVCGDGKLAGEEQCDDGNTVVGDGCDANCKKERSSVTGELTHNCTTSASCGLTVCNEFCGNGIIGASETCDDGNAENGDGCSSACRTECGWTCTTQSNGFSNCVSKCGDGVRVPRLEACDDGNTTPGDGCDANCRVEDNYSCTRTEACAKDTCFETCRSGKKTGVEECDDGDNDDNNGCSNTCIISCGYTCTEDASGRSTCKSTCGDGVLSSDEQCDDGNTDDGDGCSSTCTTETLTHICSQTKCGKSVCAERCGDKTKICNDQNTFQYDGCFGGCTECGALCPPIGPCSAIKCGDGIRAASEACDDGNTRDGDGCSSTCALETVPVNGVFQNSHNCTSASTSGCSATVCKQVCGSGKRDGTEECDDGNNVSFDLCSSDCKIECGATCKEDASGLSVCSSVCGDGIRSTGESCDDGNTVSGDGCSAQCLEEGDWWCTHSKCGRSSCIRNRCGDGLIWNMTETCDVGGSSPAGCDSCVKKTTDYSCATAPAHPGWQPEWLRETTTASSSAIGAGVSGTGSDSGGLSNGAKIGIIIAVVIIVVIIVIVVVVVIMMNNKKKTGDAPKPDGVVPGNPPPLESKVTTVQSAAQPETPGKPESA